MKHDIRVLNVLGSLDVGGTETRILGLLKEQEEAGVTHDFLCLSGRRGSLAGRAESCGSTVLPLRLSIEFPVLFLRLLRSRKYDVVHSRVATFSGYILVFAFLAGVPGRIAHFHSDGDEGGTGWRRMSQRTVGRLLIRLFATDVLAVSPAALRFSGIGGGRLHSRSRLAPGGVPVVIREDNSSKSFSSGDLAGVPGHRVVNVGRGAATKRRPFAAAIVAECGSDYGITFVGAEGPDTVDMVESRGSDRDSSVQFLGTRSNVQEIISNSDCLLSPSSVEGLPGVVLEALSVGTPVVASDLSGARWIADCIPGLTLVSVNADLDEWATAVRKACSQTAAFREQVRQAFASSPFTVEHANRILLDSYAPYRRQ